MSIEQKLKTYKHTIISNKSCLCNHCSFNCHSLNLDKYKILEKDDNLNNISKLSTSVKKKSLKTKNKKIKKQNTFIKCNQNTSKISKQSLINYGSKFPQKVQEKLNQIAQFLNNSNKINENDKISNNFNASLDKIQKTIAQNKIIFNRQKNKLDEIRIEKLQELNKTLQYQNYQLRSKLNFNTQKHSNTKPLYYTPKKQQQQYYQNSHMTINSKKKQNYLDKNYDSLLKSIIYSKNTKEHINIALKNKKQKYDYIKQQNKNQNQITLYKSNNSKLNDITNDCKFCQKNVVQKISTKKNQNNNSYEQQNQQLIGHLVQYPNKQKCQNKVQQKYTKKNMKISQMQNKFNTLFKKSMNQYNRPSKLLLRQEMAQLALQIKEYKINSQ